MTTADIIELAGIIFAAGGLWYKVEQVRKDVNNVGRKVRENQDATDKRIRNLSAIVQFTAPDSKEKDVIAMLKE